MTDAQKNSIPSEQEIEIIIYNAYFPANGGEAKSKKAAREIMEKFWDGGRSKPTKEMR